MVPFNYSRQCQNRKTAVPFFLPYSSPLILEEDNLKRREIMFQLFRSLTKICDSIYLPMDPNFKDLPAIQSWGHWLNGDIPIC